MFKAIVTCIFTEEDPANDNAGSYLQKIENENLVQIYFVNLYQTWAIRWQHI